MTDDTNPAADGGPTEADMQKMAEALQAEAERAEEVAPVDRVLTNLLALAESARNQITSNGGDPAQNKVLIDALLLVIETVGLLVTMVDDRAAEIVESIRDLQAILLASAPNKVESELVRQQRAAKAEAAAQGEDTDEVPEFADIQDAIHERVGDVARSLADEDEDGEDGEGGDPDAPPLSKVE